MQQTKWVTYDNPKKQERYDKSYLKMAEEWSSLSHCNRKQVGALIVKDGMIISDGYNGSPSGFTKTCEDDNGDTHWYVLHAEASGISKVAKSHNSSAGYAFYITLSPCLDCSKLILQAGIVRVVFKKNYKIGTGGDCLEKGGEEIVQIPNPSEVKYEQRSK